jgi:hypothetical protein
MTQAAGGGPLDHPAGRCHVVLLARPQGSAIGIKNRIAVALSWLWIYLTGHRSARLITQGEAGALPRRPDS